MQLIVKNKCFTKEIMMMRKFMVFMMTGVITVSMLSRSYCAVELPNLLELAKEAASGISEAAGNAAETVTDTAQQAG